MKLVQKKDNDSFDVVSSFIASFKIPESATE